jgi:hypothetical protein
LIVFFPINQQIMILFLIRVWPIIHASVQFGLWPLYYKCSWSTLVALFSTQHHWVWESPYGPTQCFLPWVAIFGIRFAFAFIFIYLGLILHKSNLVDCHNPQQKSSKEDPSRPRIT